MNIRHFIFLLLCAGCVTSNDGRCVYVQHTWKRSNSGNSQNTTCVDHEFCKRNYSISYVNLPPYSDVPVLESRLKSCCGECVNYKVINHFFNLTGLSPSSMNTSDFIIPVLGNPSKTTMYGYYFLPAFSDQSFNYITQKSDTYFVRLIKSLNNIYLLVIICLFMAIISGFITWMSETWSNVEEFPRPFLSGWFEGTWWSFISMTTVGYGDKTPKSVAGRLFAILWILIGITMFSLLTGLLTTVIMDVDNPVKPDIKNAKVGVLKYRIYDASLVALHDGIVVEANGIEFYDDLIKLIEKLNKKEIDGIVLDKLTHMMVIKEFKSWVKSEYSNIPEEFRTDLKENVEFFLYSTMWTTKRQPGERLSYGVLVKHKDVYEYFQDAITDNRYIFGTGFKLDMSNVDEKEDPAELFSASNSNFIYSVVVMAVIIGIMCMIGFTFDIYRRMYCKPNKSKPNDETTMLTRYSAAL